MSIVNQLSKTNFLKTAVQSNITKRSGLSFPAMYQNPNLNISHSFIPIKDNRYLLNLKLSTDLNQIKPQLLVCALDLSSSMHDSLSERTADQEVAKYTRLDMIKHSMNIILHCLRPEDRLSIVGFSNDSRIIIPPVFMKSQYKDQCKDTILNLKANGYTNLWSGIKSGLDLLHIDSSQINKSLLTLSDGEPNVNPPNGILESFIDQDRKFPNTSYQSHMFGYSYRLDSDLLYKLSAQGGGLFAHIPDHTMCNTVFINYLANCFTTAINRIILGYHGKNCQIGPFNPILGAMGTRRNVLLDVKINDPHNFHLEFKFQHDGQQTFYSIDRLVEESDDLELAKFMLFSIIQEGLRTGNIKLMCEYLDQLIDRFYRSSHPEIASLLTNIKSGDSNTGQIYKAFSNEEWFYRWGNHYLRYFLRSHELNVCSNFKDTSFDSYGTDLFRNVRREVEDIFADLPVPQPSLSSTPFQGNFQQSFYQPTGPCFDGDCTTTLATGKEIKLKDLKAGDTIINQSGQVSTIICVIKTKIPNASTPMVILDKLRITPYHPVKYGDKWNFPCKIKEPFLVHCQAVYNFVLDNHHIMTINDHDVITLGHGYDYDPVLVHPFFGTQRVIENLKQYSGWKEGLIVIEDYKPQYENGMICSF